DALTAADEREWFDVDSRRAVTDGGNPVGVGLEPPGFAGTGNGQTPQLHLAILGQHREPAVDLERPPFLVDARGHLDPAVGVRALEMQLLNLLAGNREQRAVERQPRGERVDIPLGNLGSEIAGNRQCVGRLAVARLTELNDAADRGAVRRPRYRRLNARVAPQPRQL